MTRQYDPAPTAEDRCPSCGGEAGDNHFDRSLCPCGDGIGAMHTYCNTCGWALDGCGFQPDIYAPAPGARGETE